MSNDERIILTVNARGDTTFCVEALKDMSTDRKSRHLSLCCK